MATCSPTTLLSQGAAFQALSKRELQIVIAQLLCNLSNPAAATVSGQDATTSGQALVDVTGLSVALDANATYLFEAVLSCTTSADTTGIKYGVQFSAAGATVEAQIIASLTTGSEAGERISALNTATSNAYLTSSAQSGQALVKGILKTGANSGNLTIQHLKVTSGVSSVRINSVLTARKIG